MLEYMEKRDYIRMEVDCAARIELEGLEPLSAIVKDLSATGLLMWVDSKIPPGSLGTAVILPGRNITPPLIAAIEIIRCDPLDNEPTAYAAACEIKEILKTDAA